MPTPSYICLSQTKYTPDAMLCAEQIQIGSWNTQERWLHSGCVMSKTAARYPSRVTGLTAGVYSGENWILTAGVYSGENWIGPRENRVPDRECDQGYMQSRLESQLGHHRRDSSLH